MSSWFSSFKKSTSEPQPKTKPKPNTVEQSLYNFIIGISAVTGVSLISAKLIQLYGFTKFGVAAKSFAAALQSKLVIIKVGSLFAKLQSLGALKLGIFGPSALAIALGVGIAWALHPFARNYYYPPKPKGVREKINHYLGQSGIGTQNLLAQTVLRVLGVTGCLGAYYWLKKRMQTHQPKAPKVPQILFELRVSEPVKAPKFNYNRMGLAGLAIGVLGVGLWSMQPREVKKDPSWKDKSKQYVSKCYQLTQKGTKIVYKGTKQTIVQLYRKISSPL